jgi:hypothetical protein
MSHPKLRGYLYQIVEIFPVEEGNGFRELHVYDCLEDAEKVMEVLELVNWNFTCYGMMMRPVWEDTFAPKTKMMEELFKEGWDANGSPTI